MPRKVSLEFTRNIGALKNHLIPFIKEFVVDVTDEIIIHEMEGLLGWL